MYVLLCIRHNREKDTGSESFVSEFIFSYPERSKSLSLGIG